MYLAFRPAETAGATVFIRIIDGQTRMELKCSDGGILVLLLELDAHTRDPHDHCVIAKG